MAGVDLSRLDGGEQSAARRALERVAYGPGATEEERRIAREELDRLSPRPAPGLPRAVTLPDPARTAPALERREPTEDSDDPADARDERPRPPELPRHRLLRRAALAAGAVLGMLAAAILIPSTLEPSSLAVFEREQTDRDRDAPLEVANAVAAGATASGRPGAGAALFASVRRLDGSNVTAFAFTDGDFVCLTASARIACTSGSAFRTEGLAVEIDDPGSGGRRISWGPKGELRSEQDVGILDPSGDSRSLLMRQCMASHGQDASETARGDVLAGPGVDPRALAFAMARLDCSIRFPLPTG